MTLISAAMHKKLARALKEGGETHTLQDILDMIREGRMQSHVVGDSWAVTQVLDYPRRRVIECFLAVGHMRDMRALENKVEVFAVEIGATLIRAFGRGGWSKSQEDHGWKSGLRVFTKELR